MKIANEKPAYTRITRREGMLSLLGGALFLAGCGGGSDDKNGQTSVNTGGTGSAGPTSGTTTTSSDANGSFSVGAVAGLGSIICNGVRFDDTDTEVVNEDDEPNDGNPKRDRKDVKLGMICRVKGRPKSRKSDKTDHAQKITFCSELLGPVESVPDSATAPSTMKVLGQTVKITAITIFEDGLGLTGAKILAINDIVEVHGFVDHKTNVMTATRIELKEIAKVKAIKLRGSVSGLTTTSFKIGDFVVNFDASTDVGNLTLKEGMVVRVKLTPTATPTTPPSGKAIKIREVEKEKETEEHENVEIKGPISEFTSNADFVVNSVKINASGVAAMPALKVGDRVEVVGHMKKGVLIAESLKLEIADDTFKFVLHGKVSRRTADGLKLNLEITSTGDKVTKVSIIVKDVNFTRDVSLDDLRADHGATLIVEGVAVHDGSGSFKATHIGLSPLGATA
jgi:Domain of unknown function (DUF5666)